MQHVLITLPTPALRVCPTCDGFPVVAVSTGTRRSDGTLPTVPAICPDCSGTGVRRITRSDVILAGGERR